MDGGLTRVFGGPLAALFGLVAIPYFQIGIVHLKFWVPNKVTVDRSTCKCDCFDTVFKGLYVRSTAKVIYGREKLRKEKPGPYQGQTDVGYKHVYFNATFQTLVIWSITVAYLILAYELFKFLFNLVYYGKIRKSMLFLIILDIYPNYYSWWSYFNYFNDDFYNQFYHQLFFTVTELLSTVVIATLCSTQNEVTKRNVMIIVCVAVTHICIGGIDQFFTSIFLFEGHIFQRVRNFGFVIPDIFHVVIALYLYKQEMKEKHLLDPGKALDEEFGMKDFVKCACFVLISVMILKFV